MDVREAILARLVEIADAIPGVDRVARNDNDVGDREVLLVVLDADEIADDSDPERRGPMAPRKMVMRPQIVIALPEAVRNAGTSLNGVRASLIAAVLGDSTLTGMTTNSRGARLELAQTAFAWGRSMQSQMMVQFAIPYILRPDQLVETTA